MKRLPIKERYCFICNTDIWNKWSSSIGKYSICDKCGNDFKEWHTSDKCIETFKKLRGHK